MPDINDVAKEALALEVRIQELVKEMDGYKTSLRELAGGETLKIVIPGCGTVSIAKPRKGGEKTGTKTILNEDRLNLVPELRTKLIEKGILKIEDVISTPAVAAISIKPNV